MKKIAIINGPNLDRLGRREPEVYGKETLADLESKLRAEAGELPVELTFFQSNHEGALIEHVASLADRGTGNRPVASVCGGGAERSDRDRPVAGAAAAAASPR